MIGNRTRAGIAAFAVLAILTAFIARRAQPPRDTLVDDLDTRLNYAVYEFTGRLLNEDGGIKVEIAAPMLRSNAETGIGTVFSPELRMRTQDERWKITAESAIITADREHVSLQGQVHLASQNVLTDEQTDIRTRDVVLNLTPRTASTDSAVSIVQPGIRLNAIGMKLDMTQERYELLDKVTAQYEPP